MYVDVKQFCNEINMQKNKWCEENFKSIYFGDKTNINLKIITQISRIYIVGYVDARVCEMCEFGLRLTR